MTRPMNAQKFDSKKPALRLLPPSAILSVGRVLTYGAEKYAPGNWRGVESHRYISACLRHVFAYMGGERVDDESGMPHLAHAACCLLFVLDREESSQ